MKSNSGGNTQTNLDLKTILQKIYQGRKTIYRAMAIAFVVGVFLVILTPKTYQTKVVLLAESNAKNGGGGLLGQLGSMSNLNVGDLIGLNINSSSNEALTSDLYPDIVKSTPFLLDLLQQKITYPGNGKLMTVAEYLRKYASPSPAGIPGYILGKITGSSKKNPEIKKYTTGVLKLTKQQNDLLKTLKEMITVTVQNQEGKLLKKKSKIFSLTVEAQNPEISALLADSVMNCLKRYVVDYNTRKATKDLEFIKARYDDARQNYYLAQKRLANYSDSNNNVILKSVAVKKERLTREFNLAATIYTSLAQLYEKAKIRVQDHTPVFTVIEPPKVPLRKSAPKTTLILIGLLLVGAFIGFTIELYKIIRDSGWS